ncbi:hypothetical protein BDZ94DRAFT_1057726 [Collybia nuda]|uniref:Uncharacterized protein n=1 Tax=Collybia nuda TaxID=64659 RepID=A0A9P6CEI3_9AGAR|nr:hypothetical protein BDZ94DRAFT_1057726 [Collybia nuda]
MENLPAPRPWAPHKSPQVSAAVTTPLPGSTLTQTSDGSTVQGIGALSGKAIKALGNVVLLGLDYVIILARINSILPKFPHTDAQATSIEGVQEMYDMILELSRPKLYSRCITRTALTLVLVQINCGHTRELEQALKRWNYRDCVAFLHTLVSRSMRQGIHINLTGSIVILDPKMIISLMCRIAQQSEQGCQAVLRVGFVQLFLSARTTHFSTSRLADVYRTILYFSQRYERRFRALREEAIQFLAYLISSPRRLFIRALRTWNVNDLRGLVSMVLENTAPSG